MEFSEYFPIWDKLTKDQQERVAQVIEYREVKLGTHIHDSSADCLGLVMVKTGQLRAYILSEDGREITISRLFPYDSSLLSAS
jgi:CRP/FNR family transcriptional regulator